VNDKFAFQYCQKIVLFSEDWSSVLVARRTGEADYDGTFTFIGGKMETDDASILEGVRREKNEEIGPSAKIRVYMGATNNVLFHKKDGSAMILPHILAQYVGGEIRLNPEEYSEYRWVPVKDLPGLEPKVANIPELVDWALKLQKTIPTSEFKEI
jgi:NADH pyrophosphatase NudC (nudix superfamily)